MQITTENLTFEYDAGTNLSVRAVDGISITIDGKEIEVESGFI